MEQTNVISKQVNEYNNVDIEQIQDILIVWLDSSIHSNNPDCQNTITQLQQVVTNVHTFTDNDQCIEFILNTIDKKHEQWVKPWFKVKGVSIDITNICQQLQQITRQYEQNTMPMSFVASRKRLDQLEPSFINDRKVALSYAESNSEKSGLIGILFVMKIDPVQSTTPYASVGDINDIIAMNGNERLYEVKLSLTSDNDPELSVLTKRIREESFPHAEGWQRMSLVLNNIGQSNVAERICKVLHAQAINESNNPDIYNQFGSIKYQRGQYGEAIKLDILYNPFDNPKLYRECRVWVYPPIIHERYYDFRVSTDTGEALMASETTHFILASQRGGA
ncbi:hypothetical protein I4U23_022214 [Adineta vaga]|nr:hypothetical protein I4U23_022214 [Adineta vaga]